jgi:hypothetical protein
MLVLGGSLGAVAVAGETIRSSGECKEAVKMETGAKGENLQGASDEVTGKDQLVSLVQVLGRAYENALTHETTNPAPESEDAQLERASIRLSSRIVSQLTAAPCLASRSSEDDRRQNCVLDDDSVGLKGLADLLSNAAGRLQRIGSSNPPVGDAGFQNARIKSMEHLYRMTFALSRAYFDQPQRGVYLAAAREQLGLARRQIRREQDLCRCNRTQYNERLSELADVDGRLKRSD